MHKLPVLIAVALALPAVPALAGDTNKPSAKDPERTICRATEITGSRLGSRKKVCKTAAEWDAEAAKGRNTVQNSGASRR